MSTDGTTDERRITTDTGPFAIVPEWVLDLPISDRSVRLYAILSRYADSDGYCWPSRRTLADRIGCSVDTLDRAVRELVESDVLVVTARFDPSGDRTSNGYLVRRLRAAPVPVGSRTTAATGSREDAATGSRTAAALTRTRENETHTNENAPARTGAARPVDVVWETLLEVCGIDPSGITGSSRGAYNRAAKDLRAVGATREEIVARAWTFRKRWPEVSLTPTALARRWPECDPDAQHGTAPPLTAADRLALDGLVDAWKGETR